MLNSAVSYAAAILSASTDSSIGSLLNPAQTLVTIIDIKYGATAVRASKCFDCGIRSISDGPEHDKLIKICSFEFYSFSRITRNDFPSKVTCVNKRCDGSVGIAYR